LPILSRVLRSVPRLLQRPRQYERAQAQIAACGQRPCHQVLPMRQTDVPEMSNLMLRMQEKVCSSDLRMASKLLLRPRGTPSEPEIPSILCEEGIRQLIKEASAQELSERIHANQ
jgi:hypothetical protein